ncbi:MAG TPA: lipid II flippase MurJ [Dermatophilaceae bacterium]|nr:lipid II flippase MurJ [Dermatophilaceae bacterium]
MTASRSVLAAAGLIGLTTLAARVVGFGRWLVFSHSVGAGCVGEAYSSANILPNVLFEVAAGGALAAVAVPLVAGRLGRGDRDGADATASALLTWAVSVLLPLSLVLALLARPLVRLLYRDGSCPGGAELAASMLVVFAPQVVLYGMGIVLAGVLQAHRRFLAAAVAPLLSSLVVIATYLLYAALPGSVSGTGSAAPTTATTVLAAGTTLGVVALSLPLLVPVARAGVRLRPAWRFPAGAAASARRLAAGGVVALAAQQLAVLVSFAVMHRYAPAGTVNVYQYVQAVYLLPYAVLAVPIATAAFPALAAAGPPAPGSAPGTDSATGLAPATDPATGLAPVDAGAVAAGAATLAAALRSVVGVAALGVAVLVVTAAPVAGFFARLDAAGSRQGGGTVLVAMGPALVAFAPGLVGFGVAALLSRALYARGEPLLAGVLVAAGWAVAALLPVAVLAWSPPDGPDPATRTLAVLGVSSSAGMTLAAAGLLMRVRAAWGPAALSGLRRAGAASGLALLAGAALGGVVLLWRDWFDPLDRGAVPLGSLLSALVCASVAGLVVAVVLVRLDPDGAGAWLRGTVGRLRRRRSVTVP